MATKEQITVLGAGNGGRAMAAYLATIGHKVNIYNRTPENIPIIKQQGGLYLRYSPDLEEDIFPVPRIDQFETETKSEYSLTQQSEILIEDEVKQVFAKFNRITSNIEEAIKDVSVIMVVVPATGHKYLAAQCAPFLKNGQMILLNPGRFFGAIEFYKIIHDYYKEKKKQMPDITVAEAQTFVYAARRYHPRSIRILGVKNSVDVAAIPSNNAPKIIESVIEAYPQFTPVKDVLVTSLSNLGGIFHVPITVLNATRIDLKHDFDYYVEGVTEHIAAIIEDLDKERIAIAAKCGVNVPTARIWLHLAYGSDGIDLYESVQNTHAYKGIDSPQSVNHRYIWEEVPCSLVPLSSLGEKIGVSTPLTNSFINQATSLMRKDLNINFFERGRTMTSLGLNDVTIDQIKEFIDSGEIF